MKETRPLSSLPAPGGSRLPRVPVAFLHEITATGAQPEAPFIYYGAYTDESPASLMRTLLHDWADRPMTRGLTRVWRLCYMVNDLTIIEQRCDWLSCSAPEGPKASALKLIATTNITREWERGDKITRWGQADYSGNVCGMWSYAEGPKGVIVRVTGTESAQWLPTLAHYADHFSRIDYCVTTSASEMPSRPSDALYQHFLDRQTEGRPEFKVKQLREWKGGSGVQVGARSGAYHIRVYDKFMESKGLYPEHSWRWEVEMKRHASEMEQLYINSDQHRVDQSIEIVSAVFDRWEVPMPWDTTTKVNLAKAPPRRRDYEKALQWFREQVAPTVEWLIAAGRETEAREALNLSLPVEMRE